MMEDAGCCWVKRGCCTKNLVNSGHQQIDLPAIINIYSPSFSATGKKTGVKLETEKFHLQSKSRGFWNVLASVVRYYFYFEGRHSLFPVCDALVTVSNLLASSFQIFTKNPASAIQSTVNCGNLLRSKAIARWFSVQDCAHLCNQLHASNCNLQKSLTLSWGIPFSPHDWSLCHSHMLA